MALIGSPCFHLSATLQSRIERICSGETLDRNQLLTARGAFDFELREGLTVN
jgi:hypothetical protein